MQSEKACGHVGNFVTDTVRIVERETIVGPDSINCRVRIEDANEYMRPFTIRAQLKRKTVNAHAYADKSWDGCHEGELSADHMLLPAGGAT